MGQAIAWRGRALKLDDVVFVHHAPILGGSTWSLLACVRAVEELGRRAHVVAGAPTPAFDALLEDSDVATTVLSHHVPRVDGSIVAPSPFSRAFWVQVRSLFRLHSTVDSIVRSAGGSPGSSVIHLNSSVLAVFVPRLRARQPDLRVIVHVREPPSRRARVRVAMVRRWLSRADHVVFLSKHDADRWAVEAPASIVPNWLQPGLTESVPTRADARERLGVGGASHVIAFLGATSRIKGIYVLIEALGQLRGEFGNLRVLLPGASSLRQSGVKRMARRVLMALGRPSETDQVEAAMVKARTGELLAKMPATTNIAAILAASDLLVAPSTEPHFSRPVIEAGAMARPVVASRLPGLAELVRDGITGILVAPNSANELADGIRRVLVNPEAAEAMGVAAQDYVTREHGPQVGVERLAQVYASLRPESCLDD